MDGPPSIPRRHRSRGGTAAGWSHRAATAASGLSAKSPTWKGCNSADLRVESQPFVHLGSPARVAAYPPRRTVRPSASVAVNPGGGHRSTAVTATPSPRSAGPTTNWPSHRRPSACTALQPKRTPRPRNVTPQRQRTRRHQRQRPMRPPETRSAPQRPLRPGIGAPHRYIQRRRGSAGLSSRPRQPPGSLPTSTWAPCESRRRVG